MALTFRLLCFFLFWIQNVVAADFDRFNSLFENASINIPDDFVVTQKILFTTLTLRIRHIKCYRISVGDISVSHDQVSTKEIDVLVDVTDLDIKCDVDYKYDYGFLHGTGVAYVSTDNNALATRLSFESQDFGTYPPSSSSVESCMTDIRISGIEFTGDFVSDIVEIFEGMIRGVIESEIEKVACNELGSLGTSFVSDMLGIAEQVLGEYDGNLDESGKNDPLHLEHNAILPEDLVPLDLQNTENVIGSWFNQALKEADLLLGSTVPDPDGPNADKRDLGINILMRSYVLDENRALVVDIDNLPMDAVLFKGHDRITETTISLNSVKVMGLDTLARFNPLTDIGKLTLQNELTWRNLSLEFDVTVDVMPSTREDAILQDSASTGISEQISIAFGVDNTDVVASLFLAIDQEALGTLEIGPLLTQANIYPCLLSVIHRMELSGLHVDPLSVRVPTLQGFVSPGIDRIVTNSVRAAFAMYTGVLRQAIPTIFQTSIRDFVNNEVIGPYISDSGQSSCPDVSEASGFIDFRDLFLPPETALSQGGTGNTPYGDIAYKIKGMIEDNLLSVEEDGLLKLNSFLVRPLTESQSGIPGTINFLPEPLFVEMTKFANQYVHSFVDRFKIGLFDLRINNLDTLMPPVKILETMNEAHRLTNSLNIGPVPSLPINMTTGFVLSLEGDDSPLSMHHVLDLGVSISSAAFEAALFANVDANRLLHFPLKDIMIPECWLALVLPPTLDENGSRMNDSKASFSIYDTVMSLSSFDFDFNVISSTSRGLDIIPELFLLFKTTGGVDFLRSRIAGFGEELLAQDKIQMQIDQALVNAPRLCPHSLEYNEGEVSGGSGLISFPDFSAKTVDSMFYSATFAAEVAFVAFLESHRVETAESTAALSAQTKVSSPNSFYDLSNAGWGVSKLLDLALEEIKTYLSGPTDSSSTDPRDLGINVMIKDWLLKGNEDYVLLFDDETFELQGVKIEILSLTFGGLDSFTSFSIWDVIAPQTIQNKLSLDGISVKLDMRATDSETMKTIQSFALSASLENIQAEIPVFLALDQGKLDSLSIGSLLQTEGILSCLLSAIDSVQVTQMNVTFDSFKKPKIEGLLSESDASIQNFTDQLLASYGDMIQNSLPIVIDGTLRKLLNKLAGAYLESNECSQGSVGTSNAEFVDFRDLFLPVEVARTMGANGSSPYGDLFRTIFGYVQGLVTDVDATTGLLAVNDIIVSQLTEAHSGSSTSLLFPGDLFSGGSRVKVGGLDAEIKFQASEARIDNLDTIGAPLVILDPVMNEPNTLNNTVRLGAADRPLRFAVRFLLSLMGDDDMQLRNDVEISLDLYSMTMILQTMFKVDDSRFRSFSLGDILDYNCWLATIPAPTLDAHGIRSDAEEPSAELRELVASVAAMHLNVSCIECSSPGMSELSRLLSTSEAQEDMTETINSLFEYITELVSGNYLQVQIDRLLNDAARKCPHRPEYEPNTDVQYEAISAPDNQFSISFLLMLTALAGSMVIAVLALTFMIKCFVHRRHRKWLKSLPGPQVQGLVLEQERDANEASDLNAATKSMFTSQEIPLAVRLAMPFVILANIGLFVSGHLSLGATVNIEAELAGENIRVEKFFEFSMARSTIDIWNAGGKELAILILVFSGIWPYMKQLITLVLWFLPPSRCSVYRRESILLWLDCLGKWSMIDIFVLVISIAAFRLSIISPDFLFLPEDFYSVDLLVVPLWGLYANMIAQLVSQVSSHYIIHYHRRVVSNATARINDEQTSDDSRKINDSNIEGSMDASRRSSTYDDDSRLALHQHCYGRPHRGETDKLVVKPWVNKALLLAAFCLLACIVIGSSVPSFSLEILGIIGVAVESGQAFKDASKEHTIFTVVELFFEEARFLDTAGDYVGLGTLSALFVFTVLLVPLIQTFALLKQWFSPSTKEEKVRMSIIIEILQAWQYAEVYLIAIFVASWQLGPISEFMINSYCKSLKDTFGELVYYGLLEAEDAQCFSVKSTIEGGSYILAIGAVLLSLLNAFVSKAVKQYFRDKKEEKNLLLGQSTELLLRDDDSETGSVGSVTKIRPVPVLFTDTFRWMLIRDDRRIGSNSFFAAFGYHKINARLPSSAASQTSPSEDVVDIEQNSHSSDSDGSDSVPSDDDKGSDHFEDESGWSSVEESTYHSGVQ